MSDPPLQRVKITVRGDHPRVELRGYIDVYDLAQLGAFSEDMKPYGLVVASFADRDYDPFNEALDKGYLRSPEAGGG